MSRLGRRVAKIGQVMAPAPDPAFLAYAREVVAYGGGDPGSGAAVDLARWLEGGRRRTGCAPR